MFVCVKYFTRKKYTTSTGGTLLSHGKKLSRRTTAGMNFRGTVLGAKSSHVDHILEMTGLGK